jgi:hypothetical protein
VQISGGDPLLKAFGHANGDYVNKNISLQFSHIALTYFGSQIQKLLLMKYLQDKDGNFAFSRPERGHLAKGSALFLWTVNLKPIVFKFLINVFLIYLLLANNDIST